MASESIANYRSSASWAIDSELIQAQGMIVNYSNLHERTWSKLMHATLQTESTVALAHSVFKISHRLLHSMTAFESATPTFPWEKILKYNILRDQSVQKKCCEQRNLKF